MKNISSLKYSRYIFSYVVDLFDLSYCLDCFLKKKITAWILDFMLFEVGSIHIWSYFLKLFNYPSHSSGVQNFDVYIWFYNAPQ